MEYVILGLLMIQPATLYSINKAFEQGISLFYSPSLGSINSASKRLLEKGWVSQEKTTENGRAKIIFSITKEGEAAFSNWMAAPLDLKNLEVSFLSKLYFLGLIENDGEKKQLLINMRDSVIEAKNVLDQTQASLNTLELPKSYQGILKYQKKVLGYGIDSHAFALDWIENLIRTL